MGEAGGDRWNALSATPVSADTDYASVIESSVPVIVKHTRLDSWQSENVLLSTIAYASNEQGGHNG